MNSIVAPRGAWEPARVTETLDAVSRRTAVDPRQSRKLGASILIRAVERITIQAVVTIQAYARGYLVRRTIKVWHHGAIVIQAAWRGYWARQDLARHSRAATIIQATWRGFCICRDHTQPTLPEGMWAEMGSRARSTSNHRCFQSCWPRVCILCQSLSLGPGSPPSVLMLVGSSPRLCHVCGRTLPTQVVHGMGQGAAGRVGGLWGCTNQPNAWCPQQPHRQIRAATTIQSTWRGFTVRHWMRQQQVAAKTIQATWRGHHTRACLTTDALLDWNKPQRTQ